MKPKNRFVFRTALWIGLIGLVLVVGIYYFQKENPDLQFWGALYYTIRLFILEHDLPSFPRSWPLITIYFFAPLIAFTALWRAIRYIFQFSPIIRTRWMRNHVIVCGVGRTGKNLLSMMKEKGISVVGVDLGPPEIFDDWNVKAKISMVYGDFFSKANLERAGASNARSIIFASGNDLLNLEGAMHAYEFLRSDTGPVRLLWTHIANEKLADAARFALQTTGTVGIRIFDTYRIAAEKMIERYFTKTAQESIQQIIIVGFGKFGRDLFEALVREMGADSGKDFRIVDVLDRESDVQALAKELDVGEHVSFMQSDIKYLNFKDGNHKAIFLCTDDDIGNLSVALMLTRKNWGKFTIVRMASWPMPAIESQLCENSGLTFVNIHQLVKDGIEDMAGVFKPASKSDLKRALHYR